MSETFLKVIQHIDSFQGKSSLKVWILQIAKHTYYSSLRAQKDDHLDIDEREVSAGEIIEDRIIIQEEAKQALLYLNELQDPYQEVFRLRYFAQLSFVEIAKMFNQSTNWAYVTYYRARQKLQEKLEADYE